MPVTIKKVDGYRVSTPGGTKAKRTTKRKAEAQRRLLEGVERGWKPTGKPSKLKGSGEISPEKAGSFSNRGSYGDVKEFMEGRD